MPRRPDGRIEPGQRLASAISARAWNRAQDAVDIVLGERTGFGAEAGTPYKTYQEVLCTNFSGRNIRQYEAVFLSYNVFPPDTAIVDIVCRASSFPDAILGRRRDNRFAVAVEPIRQGRTGRVAISGVVPCLCVPAESDRRGAFAVASGLQTNPSAVVPNPSGFARILGFAPYFDPDSESTTPSTDFRLAVLDLNQQQTTRVSVYEPSWPIVDNTAGGSSSLIRTNIPERDPQNLTIELEDASFRGFNAIANLPQGNKTLVFIPTDARESGQSIYMLVAAQCESNGVLPNFDPQ
jgi:hypothetical protein